MCLIDCLWSQSERDGTRIYKAVTVLDMDGVGRDHMNAQVLKY